MENQFWTQAIAAFLGAGIWLGTYFLIRSSVRSTHPLYGWAMLILMVSAILVPIFWVTLRNRLHGDNGTEN